MESLVFPALRARIEGSRLELEIPRNKISFISALLEKAEYLRVSVSKPGKSRSTGPKSQCNWINSAIQYLAKATGDDFDRVKMRCKMRAVSMGWPFYTESFRRDDGVIVEFTLPESEAVSRMDQASILIEAIKIEAAECLVLLPEVFDDHD